jgi:hypothetical protein
MMPEAISARVPTASTSTGNRHTSSQITAPVTI